MLFFKVSFFCALGCFFRVHFSRMRTPTQIKSAAKVHKKIIYARNFAKNTCVCAKIVVPLQPNRQKDEIFFDNDDAII